MESAYIADVEDGLCVAIDTISGKTVQIDCGSQHGNQVAFDGWLRTTLFNADTHVFVLSHFHNDHYNGLLHASHVETVRRPRLAIEAAYYPRIPDFKRNREFFLALFAINQRVFGSESGVMGVDFLEAISRITLLPTFRYRSVCEGDVIHVNGSAFEVLWPPLTIEDKRSLSAVRRALDAFNRAISEDAETRRLYEQAAQDGAWEKYFAEEGGIQERTWSEHPHEYPRLRPRTELPDIVIKANELLRHAANHMGLALFEDNRLLFLGDVGPFEIRQIVERLRSCRRTRFFLLVAAHHGTHWHDSLSNIQCTCSVASVGSRLSRRLRIGYKEIAETSLATWANGDIVLPWPRRLWRPWL